MKCKNCDNEVSKNRKFCCISCATSYNTKQRYANIRKQSGILDDTKFVCAECGKNLDFLKERKYQRKFCCKECSIKYNSRHYKQHRPRRKRPNISKCLSCGKDIVNINYHIKKYCDNICLKNKSWSEKK